MRVIVCLGAFAWDGALRALRAVEDAPTRPARFGHAAHAEVSRYTVLGCYHPSQQNTFTGRLTQDMLDAMLHKARELMQALNEEGLQLEQHPGDAEIIRRVRRTVHTLKGDSAACGYRELSQLAHELEDVLTPELGKTANGSLAELVLSAADTFDAMLKAYRGNAPIPSGDALRAYIRLLTHPVVTEHQAPLERRKGATQAIGGFAWSEYEQMVIAKAASAGQKIVRCARRRCNWSRMF